MSEKREALEAAMDKVGISPDDVTDVLMLLQERFGQDLGAFVGVLTMALAHVILERNADVGMAMEDARRCPLTGTVKGLAEVRAEAGIGRRA